MSYELNPKQALFVWRMLTGETPEVREPTLSRAKPDLKKDRQPMVDHGYLTVERRPGSRASFLVPTDKAWAWAATHTDVELMKSNSSVGAEALQGLLRRLLPFLQRQDLALASLFLEPSPEEASAAASRAEAEAATGPSAQEHPPGGADSLAAQIEATCLSLAGGARKSRVPLAALRSRLSSVERSALDEALLGLQDAGRLVLYRDDNTGALTAADHEAALLVGDAPRHLVYLESAR